MINELGYRAVNACSRDFNTASVLFLSLFFDRQKLSLLRPPMTDHQSSIIQSPNSEFPNETVIIARSRPFQRSPGARGTN
jgi:hypothetical protein